VGSPSSDRWPGPTPRARPDHRQLQRSARLGLAKGDRAISNHLAPSQQWLQGRRQGPRPRSPGRRSQRLVSPLNANRSCARHRHHGVPKPRCGWAGAESLLQGPVVSPTPRSAKSWYEGCSGCRSLPKPADQRGGGAAAEARAGRRPRGRGRRANLQAGRSLAGSPPSRPRAGRIKGLTETEHPGGRNTVHQQGQGVERPSMAGSHCFIYCL